MECLKKEPTVMTRSRTNSMAQENEELFPSYIEHEDVTERSKEDVTAFLKKNKISIVDGKDIPKPIQNFKEGNYCKAIRKRWKAEETYVAPTPIQSAAWPIALQGRDMIGIAQTGSGKTLSFILPAITHCMSKGEHKKGNGPIVLVLAPTRELAIQIEQETQKFAEPCGVRCVAIYGGVPKHDQIKKLSEGIQIVIATPGRLMDLMECEKTDMKSCEYFVLDEADRMLDMGFERDINHIINQTKSKNRQTLMFSATWPLEIQRVANTYVTKNTVHIKIGKNEDEKLGERGATANTDITQEVQIIKDPRAKFGALKALMKQITKDNTEMKKILIFCLYKMNVDKLEALMLNDRELNASVNCEAWGIHGGNSQQSRDQVYTRFKIPTKDFTMQKNGKKVPACNIMIATDVASRGLDVKDVDVVINYELPLTFDDYVHRVGRTGRAGKKGLSFSFLNPQSEGFLVHDLMDFLTKAGQKVSKELEACSKTQDGRKRWVKPAAVKEFGIGTDWSKGPSKSISLDGPCTPAPAGDQNKRNAKQLEKFGYNS